MSELRRSIASINEDVLAAMDLENEDKPVLGELGSIAYALIDLEEDVAKLIAERDALRQALADLEALEASE